MSASNRGVEIFRIVMVGGAMVGKSQLLARYVKGEFFEEYNSTLGIDFQFKSRKVAEKSFKEQIWDTAGIERFRSITTVYYRGADSIVLVFDLTNLESFENIKKVYLRDVADHAKNDVRIFLVGNKSDLTEERTVSQDAINKLVNDGDNGILEYFPVSAKTGLCVEDMFHAVTESILKQRSALTLSVPEESKSSSKENDNVELSSLLPNTNNIDVPTPKEVLVARLEKYIRRIDSYDNFGVDNGFWFFRKTRVTNRCVNYFLAKTLLEALQKSDGSIDDIKRIFSNIQEQRNNAVDSASDQLSYAMNLDWEDEKGRGIHSVELNQAIDRAEYFIKRSF